MTSDSSNRNQGSEVDIAALARKYVEERTKRLRPDGIDQYRSLDEMGEEFARDPHADRAFSRAPVRRETDVLIVGGGFAGLLGAANLRKAGISDIVIVDRAADFGGTWYWNRYPGVRCDVESYVYLPLLEETGFIPSEKYARGAEIQEHCQRIARHLNLYDDALLQTGVTSLDWDETKTRWIARTDRGDLLEAQFVLSCTGLFNCPKLPAISGIESFRGHSFHTSRWDYDYTGGNAGGAMPGLAGKRVGLIGTGSTGIQCVPPLAEAAEHLYVFQRTPSSIDVRGNRPTDPEWAASLKPGWQRERMLNFTNWTSGVLEGEDMVDDSWTAILRQAGSITGGQPGDVDPAEVQRSEILRMQAVRDRVSRVVKDPDTAEALKPYYNYFCKRPGFCDFYLETYNRSNVTLVDTQGKGVERITPDGLVVAGKEYPLDCLVFATGFEYLPEYGRENGMQITGRAGLTLQRHWHRGARTLYGVQTHGFPNFFLMRLAQSGVSINYMHTADAQTSYIAKVIAACRASGAASVEVTQAAENGWVDKVLEGSDARRAFMENCTPGYANREGRAEASLELNTGYGGSGIRYLQMLAEAGADGVYPDLVFS